MKKIIWIIPVIVVFSLNFCGRNGELHSLAIEEKSEYFHDFDDMASEPENETSSHERKIIKNSSITPS